MRVEVNEERARAVGAMIGRAVKDVRPDPFDDPRYYPPPGAPRRQVMSYFLVMVAMDHRLSRGRRQYEAVISGELYHGADLLYRLGAQRLSDDPGFFEAERLAKVTEKDVEEWLTVKDERGGAARPPDPSARAELLRDLGVKLLRLFDGDPMNIVLESKGYLRTGVSGGFIDLLKAFKAYQDPVEKKAFLLAKFIERRGVIRFQDPQNKDVPVDNHLTRIALRTGIVEVDRGTLARIARRLPFEPEEDALLRLAVRRAYRVVAQEAGLDPFVMDDFLWLFGRRCCTFESPSCAAGCSSRCSSMGGCSGGACVLAKACKAFEDRTYLVPEHSFQETWWY
ncbi:MAG: hypothetical protein CISAcid_10640 [uncultured Acidilobus sp. CIS]|nr:MAG: hypothetical protein CISAcid_10640 [uncultured Acidilobus sp. CIS]